MELLRPRPSRDPPPKLDVVLPNSEGRVCLAVSLLQLQDMGFVVLPDPGSEGAEWGKERWGASLQPPLTPSFCSSRILMILSLDKTEGMQNSCTAGQLQAQKGWVLLPREKQRTRSGCSRRSCSLTLGTDAGGQRNTASIFDISQCKDQGTLFTCAVCKVLMRFL